MENRFDRLSRLVGDDALLALKGCRVAVFGVGGVGGYALESLARSGIGEFDLIDNDVFSITNLNRQILATEDTIGKSKVEVAKDRVLSINPEAKVNLYPHFHLPESPAPIDLSKVDYVLDCIDTVSAKVDLIKRCSEIGVPIISCLGCGNRLDPSKLRIEEIEKTEMDPLAKVIRKKCRELGLRKIKVVYSLEPPTHPIAEESKNDGGFRKDVPGSSAFVPAAAGLMMGSFVFRELLAKKKPQ